MSQSKAEKALHVLTKNLNVYDLKELVELLEVEIEKQSQEIMQENLNYLGAKSND